MSWHLSGAPMTVQAEALRRAAGRARFGYLLDPGLGKTALVLHDLVETGCYERCVIVAPNSVKGVWRDEIAKWTKIDPATVCVWPNEPARNTGILVMNYEALLSKGYGVLGDFVKRGPHATPSFLVFDESHRIKNPQAKTAKLAIALAAGMDRVRILTGTPMTNTVMDLWPQLRALGAIPGTNPFAFRNRYAVMGGYMGKQVVGARNEEELQQIISSVAFRATKAEWSDLPEKLYSVREFEMEGAQRKAYKQMYEDFVVMLNDENAVTADMVVTQLNKLQQISRGFLIDGEGKVTWLVEPKNNPAFKLLEEILDETPGKTIIFTRHRETNIVVTSFLNSLGKHPAVLSGGMNEDETAREKKFFNEGSECRVMVAQVSVGAMGHTLLGGEGRDRCNTTVFFENSYALGDRIQAEDRNHRQGQTNAVLYLDMACSPVDRKVIAALQQKKSLVAAVVDAVR